MYRTVTHRAKPCHEAQGATWWHCGSPAGGRGGGRWGGAGPSAARAAEVPRTEPRASGLRFGSLFCETASAAALRSAPPPVEAAPPNRAAPRRARRALVPSTRPAPPSPGTRTPSRCSGRAGVSVCVSSVRTTVRACGRAPACVCVCACECGDGVARGREWCSHVDDMRCRAMIVLPHHGDHSGGCQRAGAGARYMST